MSASVCKIIRIFSCFVYSVGTRKEKYILIWWQLLAIAKQNTKNGSKTLPKKCRYVHFALWDFSCFCFKAINPLARGYFKNIAKYRLDTLKFHNYKKQNRVSILQCPENIFRISYWNLLYYRLGSIFENCDHILLEIYFQLHNYIFPSTQTKNPKPKYL